MQQNYKLTPTLSNVVESKGEISVHEDIINGQGKTSRGWQVSINELALIRAKQE